MVDETWNVTKPVARFITGESLLLQYLFSLSPMNKLCFHVWVCANEVRQYNLVM